MGLAGDKYILSGAGVVVGRLFLLNRQCVPTNRTHFLSWLNHKVGFALRAFEGIEFDSFDFVRIQRGDHLPTHFAPFLLR